ncbi:MAG: glutamine synthetase type III, partial [Kiritimatiellae bacterium]|nr:glutamine synthetase type III [Kiritimatiellia bacterium]
SRVIDYMTEVDQQLWKLGIPAKTRHNEVAPAQFELAPVFEELNLAVDHNMLVMEILRQVAERHNFVCLMHEKPFAGVNGSGKHNNWSPSIPGRNLLNPGSNPHENAIFLTFLCATIKAVDKHADLMRSSVACAGNDHRLGANEAPPAIISIFLGEQLTDVIEQIECGGAKSTKHGGSMTIGVDALPELPRDATDRNRTSPFAFTGNKFEFRAVGSTQSCAGPNIVINTIVAEALDDIASELEKSSEKMFNKTLQKILQKIIKDHKRVIFNGDNYNVAWHEEAAKRGLPNLVNTPAALKALKSPKAKKLFKKYKVFSNSELLSRYEVFTEEYDMTIMIEGKLMLDMAKTTILPVALAYQKNLASSLLDMKQLGVDAGVAEMSSMLNEVGGMVADLCNANVALAKAVATDDSAVILKAMTGTRSAVDALEMVVDDAIWPLPKYAEMLFLY